MPTTRPTSRCSVHDSWSRVVGQSLLKMVFGHWVHELPGRLVACPTSRGDESSRWPVQLGLWTFDPRLELTSRSRLNESWLDSSVESVKLALKQATRGSGSRLVAYSTSRYPTRLSLPLASRIFLSMGLHESFIRLVKLTTTRQGSRGSWAVAHSQLL